MKKLIFACTVFLFAAANMQAQETAKVEMSKEKKTAFKKMKEEHLIASFTEVGLKDDLVKQAREVIQAAMQKSNELKADNTLTDEEKKTKKVAINDEKNAKLKEILGDKYKAWTDVRKKQKAAEDEFAGKTP